jgi:hypothetical protein
MEVHVDQDITSASEDPICEELRLYRRVVVIALSAEVGDRVLSCLEADKRLVDRENFSMQQEEQGPVFYVASAAIWGQPWSSNEDKWRDRAWKLSEPLRELGSPGVVLLVPGTGDLRAVAGPRSYGVFICADASFGIVAHCFAETTPDVTDVVVELGDPAFQWSEVWWNNRGPGTWIARRVCTDMRIYSGFNPDQGELVTGPPPTAHVRGVTTWWDMACAARGLVVPHPFTRLTAQILIARESGDVRLSDVLGVH